VLGDPKAPVTIEEFVDLQCPFCQRFSQDGLPDIVNEYVKPGKAKVVLRTLTFIGPDSERGARVAWSAAEQGRMFQFVENFYANQGQENSGYADEAFLKKVAGGVQGLDAQKALDGRDSASVSSSIQASQTAARKANVDSTPSFLVGPTGGQLSKIETRTLTIDDFREPVKDALAEAKG
jgi:protein-disulfide isomerase